MTVETADSAALTPAQARVRSELLDIGGDRPTVDRTLRERLLAELEDGLAPLLEGLPAAGAWRRGDKALVVLGKRALDAVHQCERHYFATDGEPFAWTAATARGVVAHKALELGAQHRQPTPPATLVDLAIDRLRDEPWGPSGWLSTATPDEIAQLRSAATDVVTKFADTFPPLPVKWRPRFESRLRLPLADGRVELTGKVDLALGQATGDQARVLLIDLKTGSPSHSHPADLRFYALLEAVRCGVPPFRVASYYLDSATWHAEDIDEDVLAVTVRRVVDGLATVIDLRARRRAPRESPGPLCRYCPVRLECEPGLTYEEPDVWAERP
jgi:PD-(D/E)XK nuclease superfamily protein